MMENSRIHEVISGVRPQSPFAIIMVLAGLVVLLHVLIGHPVLQTHTDSTHSASTSHGLDAADHTSLSHRSRSNDLQHEVTPAVSPRLVSVHHDAPCQEPRWVAPRVDPLLKSVHHTSIAHFGIPIAITVPERTFPQPPLPVPDGPTRQALLQRFTL